MALGTLPRAPEVGPAHPLSGNTTANVTMNDTPSFTPRFLHTPAGTTLSVSLHNVGDFTHTFTLSAKPNVVLSPALTPAELYAFFRTNGSLANVSVAPGSTGWANVSFNASTGLSAFEFVSLVPYQFQSGMYGFVNITSTGPGLELSENTSDSLVFIPNALAASPSHYPAVLDVDVTNLGTLGHTFTLAAQSNTTLTPTNYTQYFQMHPPLVSVNVPSGAGASVWANFTVTAPGVYEYICEITGHFASGMFGFLYVGVPVPPPPATPSTALVETWVLAGSGILVGIGIVLAAVAAFTGRFPRPPRSHGGHP